MEECASISGELYSELIRGALMVSCENLSQTTRAVGSHSSRHITVADIFNYTRNGSLKGLTTRSHPIQRRNGLFTNPFRSDREKMEQLVELLNHYSRNGVPEQCGLLTFRGADHSTNTVNVSRSLDRAASLDDGGFGGDVYYLEDGWKEVVADAADLPKQLQSQQDAIWELLHTEVFYIRRLKVVTDLFLACLCNLQNECILNEVQ